VNDPLLDAVAAGVRTYDLSRPYEVGMPQSPNHPAYTHALQRRHGDRTRGDGGSAANDLIVLGTHVGTHMDALAHVSQEGRLYDGVDAAEAQAGGRFGVHGIDAVPPLVRRGWLFDVPRVLGRPACEAGVEITVTDLERCLEVQRLAPTPGDILLIRSGWARRWDEGATAYVGHDTGVPGVGETGARWLADLQPAAVGADTIAFEHLPPGQGHARLPAHRVFLVERGINIIETMQLEELSADRVDRFLFVGAPLPLVGATGAPLRPLALVSGPHA